MLYPKIDDCIRVVGDKFSLVIVAARRGNEIFATMPAEVAKAKSSELAVALKEIAEGRLTIIRGATA